ncbi:sigma-70 family RNA polymerase sigma factor [Peribacillus deserti]|uniref:RNA polymerase n=1 Tax=Peribacillus deserti TaxID=673318 RepID=A0A2N5M5M2_9BACI|nr:sigma-70 family RNA polymerase sigma factor [Peribacillus deserti]PLT29635.1 RNA polymerase [Peribacillus deserti]
MDSKEHQKLVKKAAKGSNKAFEQLIKRHYEQIYRTAYLYVQNEEDALDVVQEAAYQAYRSIHSLKQPEYFMTWLTRIVIRCSTSVIKNKKNVVPLTEDILSNLEAPAEYSKEESVQLLKAIGGLKETYRTAIILFYYYDYPIKTISDVMEIPEGTVKTYLSRGKAALKKFYNGEEQNYG